MSPVTTDRNGLEVLDREQCLELLATAQLGRIAVTSGALPSIVPVNYTLVDEYIVIRTGRGTKLDAATRNAVVAFEADAIDPVEHTGWSVMVTGVSRELSREELDRVGSKPDRWAPGSAGRYIAVSTDVISGRRVTEPVRDSTGEAIAGATAATG